MKTKCIIFAIMAMACSLAASAYVPLLEDGAKWIYNIRFEDGTQMRYSLEINGERTINGVNYKACVFSGDEYITQRLFYLDGYWDGHSTNQTQYLREEDGRVYLYERAPDYYGMYSWVMFPMAIHNYNWSTKEELLYDFNDINMTFDDLWLCPEFATSGTTIINGEEAAVYNMPYVHFQNDSVQIIEGVGFVSDRYGDLLKFLDARDFEASSISKKQRIDNVSAENEIDDGWFENIRPFANGLVCKRNGEGKLVYRGPLYFTLFDFNGDGAFDGTDLNAMINVLLQTDRNIEEYGLYDISGNGEVNGNDLNILIDNMLGKYRLN